MINLPELLQDASALEFAIRDQLRMQATERLRNMAVPAYRAMGCKDIWKLLRPEVLPFDRLVIRREQGWSMI